MFDAEPDGWRRGLIGDLISEVVSRTAPEGNPDLAYVGLEHIGQGTGRLVGRGRAADVVSQQSSFEAGDILYGKLRPNLRKVARPDFSGVCSTDIIVFRANGGACPDFAFQLLRSGPVITHAIATAAGTKMPRTHARSILAFEALLPPLAEQRRIADVLGSVDTLIECDEACIRAAKGVRDALLAKHFHRADWDPNRPVPHGWTVALLDKIARRGSGHTPNKKVSGYWAGDVRWVSLQDTKRLDMLYIYETTERITQDGIANSSATMHPTGTVVLSRDATIGRSAITAYDMAVSQHFIAYTCGPKLSNLYLYYWLQRMKSVFERIGAGSTIKTIGLPFFKALRIAYPPMTEQLNIANQLANLDGLIASNRLIVRQAQELKVALAADLLSGRVRVPA